jgi:hypothetical protein
MGDSDEIMDRLWAELAGLFGGPHRMIGYVIEQSPLCMEWGDFRQHNGQDLRRICD